MRRSEAAGGARDINGFLSAGSESETGVDPDQPNSFHPPHRYTSNTLLHAHL